MVDHRTFAGQKFEVQAHGFQGQQEVGKDDRGIDVELLGGGDGDFSGEVRVFADLEQRVVAADCLVFRHIAAGLAEKPDRGAVHGLAQAGANKTAAARETGARG